jgi:endo-1,4-beta-xylanase
MVAVSKLALSLSAAAVSLAAPTEVEKRGAPNFILDENNPLMMLRRNLTERGLLGGRSSTNYVQNYKTGGTVNFNPGTDQFSLTFNTNQDFVVGVGWQPGSTAYVAACWQ